jgi:hypothetical protein
LEAFSVWPFGFNDSDVRNLSLLAELVLGALKPEDEDRFAESAQAAANTLEAASSAAIESAHAMPAAPSVPVPGVAVAQKTDRNTGKKPVEAKLYSAAVTAAPAVAAIEKAPKPATTVAPAAAPRAKIAVAEPSVVKRRPITLILQVSIILTVQLPGESGGS